MDYNHSTPKNAHQTSSSCYLRTINNEMDNELKNEKLTWFIMALQTTQTLRGRRVGLQKTLQMNRNKEGEFA